MDELCGLGLLLRIFQDLILAITPLSAPRCKVSPSKCVAETLCFGGLIRLCHTWAEAKRSTVQRWNEQLRIFSSKCFLGPLPTIMFL